MKWSQPKLVVLARVNPEEAVLAGCKHKKPSANPEGANVGCLRVDTCAPYNTSMSS